MRERGLVGALFEPAAPGPHPAVIHVAGGDGAIMETDAALLAAHGFATLALGYFRQPGLPSGLVNLPLE